jgi:NAD(P)-dependent dehydrogenase (short-subunit alcohol dehydrogenase family)
VFRAARRGSIVLTSSITANLAFPAFVPYSATKSALQQMARDVALDNGAWGIRVNCVAPGPIFTQGGTVAHAEKMGVVSAVCAQRVRGMDLRTRSLP